MLKCSLYTVMVTGTYAHTHTTHTHATLTHTHITQPHTGIHAHTHTRLSLIHTTLAHTHDLLTYMQPSLTHAQLNLAHPYTHTHSLPTFAGGYSVAPHPLPCAVDGSSSHQRIPLITMERQLGTVGEGVRGGGREGRSLVVFIVSDVAILRRSGSLTGYSCIGGRIRRRSRRGGEQRRMWRRRRNMGKREANNFHTIIVQSQNGWVTNRAYDFIC